MPILGCYALHWDKHNPLLGLLYHLLHWFLVDHGSTRGGFHSSFGSRSSSSGFRGSRGGGSRSGGSRGGFRGGSSSGPGSRTRGDRKCTHCGSQGHTEPWCWQKHGRPDHVHQVMDVPSSQSSLLSTGSDASPVTSHETLTTQISELTALVQSLRPSLPSSSTATMASSGNIACVAKSSQPWLLDSGASSHVSGPPDQEDDWFGA
ncbi:putative lysozyme-like protein [Camellia sinensis]|uniref:putative lysozyme-like protein n=1 Tax=Camellia sinensis TaxID=4442 RepID=UPI001036AA9D|nr:putative lysozyme-like protein [Camellia sinensis]